jgi:hypothetical protein
MTARCRTCGRFVGACRECGARYCQRCQPMQHEHGWEPERRQKQGRRHSLRRLLAGRLRPLWLPHRPIRSRSRAPWKSGVFACAPPMHPGPWLRPDGLAHGQPCAAMVAGCAATLANRAILDDSWHNFSGQGFALSSPDSMAGAGSCQIAIAVFMRRKPSLP